MTTAARARRCASGGLTLNRPHQPAECAATRVNPRIKPEPACCWLFRPARYSPGLMQRYRFGYRHLLGIEWLSREDIEHVLDRADTYVELSRQSDKKTATLRGRTLINCFFENSTRTRTSFEVAMEACGGSHDWGRVLTALGIGCG